MLHSVVVRSGAHTECMRSLGCSVGRISTLCMGPELIFKRTGYHHRISGFLARYMVALSPPPSPCGGHFQHSMVQMRASVACWRTGRELAGRMGPGSLRIGARNYWGGIERTRNLGLALHLQGGGTGWSSGGWQLAEDLINCTCNEAPSTLPKRKRNLEVLGEWGPFKDTGMSSSEIWNRLAVNLDHHSLLVYWSVNC